MKSVNSFKIRSEILKASLIMNLYIFKEHVLCYLQWLITTSYKTKNLKLKSKNLLFLWRVGDAGGVGVEVKFWMFVGGRGQTKLNSANKGGEVQILGILWLCSNLMSSFQNNVKYLRFSFFFKNILTVFRCLADFWILPWVC